MKNRTNYTYIFLLLIVAITSIPIACNYILSGIDIKIWIDDVMGETLEGWLLFPQLIYRLSNNMTLAYRLHMLGIQAGTALTSYLFFKKVFDTENSKRPVIYGVLLYMTCPCRIYCCYDIGNIYGATLLMLFPLLAWSVLEIVIGRKRILGGAVAILIIMLNMSEMAQMPLSSILQGYQVGEVFGFYPISNEHPGLGIGLLLGLLVGLWLWLVEGKRPKKYKVICFGGMAMLFLVLSLMASLPSVSVILFNVAYFFFVVPAAMGMYELKEVEKGYIINLVQVLFVVLCIGCCIFQSNYIIYFRMPFEF